MENEQHEKPFKQMYETETMDEAKKKDEKKEDLKEEEEGLINDPKKSTILDYIFNCNTRN